MQDAFTYWSQTTRWGIAMETFPNEEWLDSMLLNDKTQRDLVSRILLKLVDDLNTDFLSHPLADELANKEFTTIRLTKSNYAYVS